MSPQVKADGQMCHEENGFCQDTLVFHSAFLLTPSISPHIRQARHMDGDTVNNTHNYRGGWTAHKQLRRGEGKEEEREKVNQREGETSGEENRNSQNLRGQKKKALTRWGQDKREAGGEGSVVTDVSRENRWEKEHSFFTVPQWQEDCWNHEKIHSWSVKIHVKIKCQLSPSNYTLFEAA